MPVTRSMKKTVETSEDATASSSKTTLRGRPPTSTNNKSRQNSKSDTISSSQSDDSKKLTVKLVARGIEAFKKKKEVSKVSSEPALSPKKVNPPRVLAKRKSLITTSVPSAKNKHRVGFNENLKVIPPSPPSPPLNSDEERRIVFSNAPASFDLPNCKPHKVLPVKAESIFKLRDALIAANKQGTFIDNFSLDKSISPTEPKENEQNRGMYHYGSDFGSDDGVNANVLNTPLMKDVIRDLRNADQRPAPLTLLNPIHNSVPAKRVLSANSLDSPLPNLVQRPGGSDFSIAPQFNFNTGKEMGLNKNIKRIRDLQVPTPGDKRVLMSTAPKKLENLPFTLQLNEDSLNFYQSHQTHDEAFVKNPHPNETSITVQINTEIQVVMSSNREEVEEDNENDDKIEEGKMSVFEDVIEESEEEEEVDRDSIKTIVASGHPIVGGGTSNRSIKDIFNSRLARNKVEEKVVECSANSRRTFIVPPVPKEKKIAPMGEIGEEEEDVGGVMSEYDTCLSLSVNSDSLDPPTPLPSNSQSFEEGEEGNRYRANIDINESCLEPSQYDITTIGDYTEDLTHRTYKETPHWALDEDFLNREMFKTQSRYLNKVVDRNIFPAISGEKLFPGKK